MALSQQSRRHRSPSDPFSDPPAISYSSYGVPTLTRNAPQQHRAPPPVPPKVPAKTSSHNKSYSKQSMPGEVAQSTRTSTESTRVRMGRSQTQMPQTLPTRPIQTTHRSLSQDSVLRAAKNADKAKASAGRKPPTKKGSSHADVIDRLDFSGVGPMFHHDGPFDACAPSRNRHRTKAPMLAWTGAAEEDKDAFANAREIPSTQSPYPSPAIYAPYEPPKKKHDAIAEAWGIHEPEPFEDFSAGGGYSGGTHSEFNNSPAASRHGTSSRRAKESGREKHREANKRSPIPPPQPIFSGGEDFDQFNPPSPTSPGAPKRTKSLMHRIRKMRDAPNVPALQDDAAGAYDDPPSPSSAENSGGHAQYSQRPTHRSQNSFLGRLAGRGRSKDMGSPTDEPYVYVQESSSSGRREKSLPAPPNRNGLASPSESVPEEYFTEGSGNLGRRASLLKKMKGAVRG